LELFVTRPQITVRIAFGNAPFDAISSLVWTDISAYVWLENNPGGQAIAITRGRQFELDKVQAGTLTLVLDNRDRRFDPDNAASPYYPNVIPTRRVNVRATWNSITYDLYTGYVESWVPLDPQSGAVGLNVVRLTAVDLLKALNYTTMTTTELNPNNPVNVIQGFLNAAGWPAADRIAGANSPTQIPAQVWATQPALTAIQVVAAADSGSFFIETDGRTAYHDRYWTARNNANQALFGDAPSDLVKTLSGAHNASVTTLSLIGVTGLADAGTVQIDSELIAYTGRNTSTQQLTGCTRGAYGSTAASHANGASVTSEMAYQDVRFSFDDTRLINHAEVTRIGGTVQTADDAASQATYGLRAVQITNLQITTDVEALSRAQYLTILFAQPYLRIQSLILNGDLAPVGTWPQILSRTFDDKITVIRRPPGGGSPIAKVARIEAINHTIGANVWLCQWQVYPVGNDQFWIVQDAIAGVLDSTTRLAY
jgi:hypothetical protein